MVQRTWASKFCLWSPSPNDSPQAEGLNAGNIIHLHICHQKPLGSCCELSPNSRYYRHAALPKSNRTPREHLANRVTSSSFPHSVQIKATALCPSFVNSIFVLSSSGSLVVCSWSVFWEAFLLPFWASAVSLEEPQSHRTSQRMRKEKQEGKKK